MSRSVTRFAVVVGVPLVALATISALGSQRPTIHAAVRTPPSHSTNVAYLRARRIRMPDLSRLARDLPDPTPASAAVPAAPVAPAVAAVAGPAVAVRPAPARPAPPPPGSTVGGAAGVGFALVNQDRAANGVAPLAYSGTLARVAQYRAQDMLNRNYFSHYDPSTGQLAFLELFHLWGIRYTTAGENIAWSTDPSMANINAMFMTSPEHRANILNGAYHQIGVGVAGNGLKVIVVEVFTN